ncbi:MAG: phosphatidate cytidylyltransferase [Anaerohalosphaeraceae bacterium]|nr:phosphatidate cytidylyltransferase [Anaerohalosphaeraceae bacterium]
MLRHRLIFGTLMVITLIGLLLFDAWIDGSISSQAPDAPVQGSLAMTLLCMVIVIGCFEIARLFKNIQAVIFRPVVIISSVLLAGTWYWSQFFTNPSGFISIYVPVVIVLSLLSFFLYQNITIGCGRTIINCGANCLAILYLGGLACFLAAIRIEFGLWAFLMFICVVKSSDIGAYTFGRLFGKHKFSPRISPKKTWEGMAGGAFLAAAIAWLFAWQTGIMALWAAVCFGVVMAFIGQLGDLAESMLKRDADMKDSASSVPGFGGVLDLIDSPVVAAVFAYLFFLLV